MQGSDIKIQGTYGGYEAHFSFGGWDYKLTTRTGVRGFGFPVWAKFDAQTAEWSLEWDEGPLEVIRVESHRTPESVKYTTR